MESKAALLPKVRDWHVLKLEEEELERLASDPNRFSKRGGAMLREEKLRKRVGVLLPKVSVRATFHPNLESLLDKRGGMLTFGQVENDILTLLPRWETEHDRPFLVNGISVVDQIYEAREAKEAAKEAKKVRDPKRSTVCLTWLPHIATRDTTHHRRLLRACPPQPDTDV